MSFELKSVSGKTILFVMAAEAEYGPFLRSRIEPLMTGVGPVEAAIALTRTLTQLDARDELPDLVVSLGSAGSATLEQTEVYQVSSVSYRDMDASPLGFERGRTPFLDLPASVELPLRIPAVPTASLSTGGNVISGRKPMPPSAPIWSTWRPSRCCAPARPTACRSSGCAAYRTA